MKVEDLTMQDMEIINVQCWKIYFKLMKMLIIKIVQCIKIFRKARCLDLERHWGVGFTYHV